MSEIILFNHIPKTAGSTMKYILWRVYGRGHVAESLQGGRHRERLEAIAEQIERAPGRYVVVTHAGWGAEELLPEPPIARFTILRDPVERTLSRYYMARSDGETEESLERYLNSHPQQTLNAQSAFLGGLWARFHIHGHTARAGDHGTDLLEQAKRNLEAHDVIGLTERFDETLLLLRRRLGWPLGKTLYRRANVRHRPAGPVKSELEAVRRSNALDLELYRFAVELFEEQRPQTRSLRRFEVLNRAYRAVHPATNAVSRVIRS